ncbi:MAG TPA: hypothetical protein VME69_06335 [Methylocella sp.]|nr:hypothetical protein [Methylocella sp.]
MLYLAPSLATRGDHRHARIIASSCFDHRDRLSSMCRTAEAFGRCISTKLQILEERRLYGAADKAGKHGRQQQANELCKNDKNEECGGYADGKLAYGFIVVFEQLALKEEDRGSFHHFKHLGIPQ